MRFLQHFSYGEIERIRWVAFTLDDAPGDMSGYELNGIPLSKFSFRRLFGNSQELSRERAIHASELDDAGFAEFMGRNHGSDWIEAAGGDPSRDHMRTSRKRRYWRYA